MRRDECASTLLTFTAHGHLDGRGCREILLPGSAARGSLGAAIVGESLGIGAME
jgi:hypothetical protein